MLPSDLWLGWFYVPEIRQEYNEYYDELNQENRNENE